MTDVETRCLMAFPGWLEQLGRDATDLASFAGCEELDDTVRQTVLGGLNYLFKSLDLIPDGIEDLGFIDDAFVLRVCAALAVARLAELPAVDASTTVRRLADQAALISEFLQEADFGRLERFARGLGDVRARGRSVAEMLEDKSLREQLIAEVAAWGEQYRSPGFGNDEKNLIKLRSFLRTKLPS
jgi:uncharacterized membrane protein YkvA (DUF1232 family)